MLGKSAGGEGKDIVRSFCKLCWLLLQSGKDALVFGENRIGDSMHEPAAVTHHCLHAALRVSVFNALKVRWPQARIKRVCLDFCFHFKHSVRVTLRRASGMDVPEPKGRPEEWESLSMKVMMSLPRGVWARRSTALRSSCPAQELETSPWLPVCAREWHWFLFLILKIVVNVFTFNSGGSS